MENRRKLAPIIRAVLFCCRQGLSLRGHRDDGPLALEIPKDNDGNFRALLRFSVDSGDLALQEHLKVAGGNATYLSHRIQNEIIDAGAEIITTELVRGINETKCFTVTADETSDVSGIEQFTIGARFVQEIEGKHTIREDFLCFVPVEDMTGAGLANLLLTTLQKLGVDTHFMKGQGYDGARAMSGQLKGCAAIVKKTCPDALYLHCANHNLNLAITHACDIAPIRNCIGTVKQVVNFFRLSSKAGNLLKKHILAENPSAKQTRLLKFCETRWVEHLASLGLFYEAVEFICLTLEDLNELRSKTDGVQPNSLLASIQTSQFIVALAVMVPVFSLTKNLSQNLQKEECDLSDCVQYANNVHEELKEIRARADEKFAEIFQSANQIAGKMGIELTVPRRVGRQNNRDNYFGSPEEYYRRSIFIPFLDKYLEELDSRFLEHRALLSMIQNIIPAKCAELDEEAIKKTASVFEEKWPNDITGSVEELQVDIKLWKRFCSNIPEKERPKSFIEALDVCNRRLNPQIYRLLQICGTLPVTVASSERSFSTLRRLKTYLRNRTGEERLNGLALLNIHRDVNVTSDQILDILAKRSRRIDITL
ncbi:52 kDa repressor of the inhibitor of the protein kinase-like [Drosophila ficusphila]|uniref:52 kDa repressor of the inhibitor of the protein kinase-like n=1 Tax=Drosophila ficusphila TaxID=30025 RepID=UPI001C8A30B5|nr:52 kDa repressor of the inhibitor of the protein kinase-like [Drosophila ficusphila]